MYLTLIKRISRVMMKLIVFIILKVNANEPTHLSSTPTPLPTSIHPFHLDNEHMTYIHHCLEIVLKLCETAQFMEYCIAKKLLVCLFDDPMHPKDYPIRYHNLLNKCYHNCFFTLQLLIHSFRLVTWHADMIDDWMI